MYDRDRSATETCLNLPEVVREIGLHLYEPKDLYAASCCSHLWQAALLPVRTQFPHVTLNHVSSFLAFLKSNRRAAHHCRALRILYNDVDDDPDSDSDSDSDVDMDGVGDGAENNSGGSIAKAKKTKQPLDLNPVSGILNHFADNGGLQFFMYALPGEPCEPLLDDVWIVLRRLSDTLQGLYVELVGRHWNTFLTSQFSNLQYLRLFLDTDNAMDTGPDNEAFDPKAALLSFLQSHPRLQVLHLYLGNSFTNFRLSSASLPALRSFLLISKAENVDIAPFIAAHPGLTSLDVYTDSEVPPFSADSLPNIQALQVSAMTVSWFQNILASAPQRANPIRHLQFTATRQENFENVLRLTAPLGEGLRCLELIFWSRDVPLLSVLEDVNRAFPKLVELSLFIPSWSSSDWGEQEKPLELGTMLQCFASNTHMLAFAVSDPKTTLLDEEQVGAMVTTSIPPHLRYIIWRSQTFRLDRTPPDTIVPGVGVEEAMLRVKRTYHPRNFRGSRFLRDWHEEMVFDHLAGDYRAQLELC